MIELNTSDNLVIVTSDDNLDWDNFCKNSPEGTPFMTSWYIDALGRKNARYFWKNNGEILAAALIYEVEGCSIRPDFSVYHSICFSQRIRQLEISSRQKIIHSILTELIDSLTSIHNNFHLSLHKDILDLRPLQWFNFDGSKNGSFTVNVKFTAIRNLPNATPDEITKVIRHGRTHDYKKSIKEGVQVAENLPYEHFLDLYIATFDRQDIKIPNSTVDCVKSIYLGAIDNDGKAFFALNSDGIPISAVLFLINKSTAYSIFMVNNPIFRKLGGNTRLIIEAMAKLKKLGVEDIDFVGANSPQRGEYKLSFNSALHHFFEATYRSTKSI
jgi:hypothetical protein